MILGAFVAALLVVPAADARKNTRDACRPKHATTEFANRRFRVFSVPTRDGDAEYLCVWRTRKRFKLAEGSGEDATGDYLNGFQSAGKFFLYATAPLGGSDSLGRIRLLNFRTGRLRDPAFNAFPYATLLTSAGTVAYTTDPARGAPRAVYALPLDARAPQQLDAGEDIDPGSLARAGHTLYWTKAGQAYSAQMP